MIQIPTSVRSNSEFLTVEMSARGEALPQGSRVFDCGFLRLKVVSFLRHKDGSLSTSHYFLHEDVDYTWSDEEAEMPATVAVRQRAKDEEEERVALMSELKRENDAY